MFWISELPKFCHDWWRYIGMNYSGLCAITAFAAFAYGACLGSFINVCLWRLPRNISMWSPIRWKECRSPGLPRKNWPAAI